MNEPWKENPAYVVREIPVDGFDQPVNVFRRTHEVIGPDGQQVSTHQQKDMADIVAEIRNRAFYAGVEWGRRYVDPVPQIHPEAPA